MNKDDIDEFRSGVDFGDKPLKAPMSDLERKIASIAMAIQATMIQLIIENAFDEKQQVHFMVHLQDFMQRLYDGEALNFPDVSQTLKVDSGSGSLFLDAVNEGIKHGHEKFMAIQEEGKRMVAAQQTEQDNGNAEPKHTLH